MASPQKFLRGCGCGASVTKERSLYATRTCQNRVSDRRRTERDRKNREAAKRPAAAMTREAWLVALTDALRPRFESLGYPIPKAVHVSVGIPSTGGKSGKVVGECWGSASGKRATHVFVSPMLNGERKAAGTLVHELAHAATPSARHGGAFVVLARLLGMEGKPKACEPGDAAWAEWLGALVGALGPFPHSALTPELLKSRQKKGRMIRGACACDPARPLYGSATAWRAGPVTCGGCGSAFAAELPDETGDDETGDCEDAETE